MNETNARATTDARTATTTRPTDPAAAPEMTELETDIARTRAELADTVDQLAAKLDVKTRIRNRVTEAKGAATARLHTVRTHLVGADGKPRPVALSVGGAVAATVAAVVLARLWMRPSRRHSRR